MYAPLPEGMRARIAKQLIADEGFRTTVYSDSERNATVGVGHLVLPGDKLDEGDSITVKRANEMFANDLETAISNAYRVVPSLSTHPVPVQEVVINMIYNLGVGGFLGFTKMIDSLERMEYVRAADEMKSSLWYKQVGSRAKRLEATMRSAK